MTTGTFEACLAETLKWEGGFSNDPFDRGGPTNAGVTLAVFAAHRGHAISETNRDWLVGELSAIGDEEVAAIYRTRYWAQVCGDELPGPLALATFDFAVNSGVARASRHLQAVLGSTIDGHIGARTLAAARAADPLAAALELNQRRRAFVRRLPTFWRFGKGWLNRINGIDRACRTFGGSVRPIAPGPIPDWQTEAAPAPLADRAAQSASQGRATLPDAGVEGHAKARAAELAGSGGGVQLGVDVAGAAAAAQDGGSTFTVARFALELAQRPSFWLAVLTIAGAAYVWIDHRRRQATL